MFQKTGLFLLLAFGTSEASTVTSTFGPDDSFTQFGGDKIGGGGSSSPDEFAVEFTPTLDVLLAQIRVAVFTVAALRGNGDLVLDLSEGPIPGAPFESFSATVATGGGGAIYAFNSSLDLRLQAGQDYWIVLTSNDLTDNVFGWNFGNTGSASLIAERTSGQTPWQTLYDYSPAFDVSGPPLMTVSSPEPGATILALEGLILIILSSVIRRINMKDHSLDVPVESETRRGTGQPSKRS